MKLKNEDHSDDKAQMEKLIKRDAKSYDDGALGALYWSTRDITWSDSFVSSRYAQLNFAPHFYSNF